MNILEFANIIDRDIVIRYYPNQDGRFCAQFDKSETKDSKYSSIIGSCFGNGKTPVIALNEYARTLAGKVLIFGAFGSEARIEYVAPSFTEVEQ